MGEDREARQSKSRVEGGAHPRRERIVFPASLCTHLGAESLPATQHRTIYRNLEDELRRCATHAHSGVSVVHRRCECVQGAKSGHRSDSLQQRCVSG